MSARSYVVDERGLANNFAAEKLNSRLAMIGFVCHSFGNSDWTELD